MAQDMIDSAPVLSAGLVRKTVIGAIILGSLTVSPQPCRQNGMASASPSVNIPPALRRSTSRSAQTG